MKKSLLAVAVASVLPAFAQAQTNVTMYGIADISVDLADLGANSRNTLIMGSGGQSTSRWGVRGSEDLGGGLKAIFQFEAGVGVDTGANDANFFQRTSTVGLQGGFGTLRLGRTYSPSFLQRGAWDAMGYGLFGNLLTTNGVTTVTRYNNGIYYNAPKMGGLQIDAAYQLGESTPTAASSSANSAMDLAVRYTAGALDLGVSAQNAKNATGQSTKYMGLGGGFNMGAFKLVGSYYQQKNPANVKTKIMSVGGVMKVGTGSLHLQVQRANPDGASNNATTMGVAYVHPMSKRTNIYAHFGTTRNDTAAQFGLTASGYSHAADAAGSDPKAIGVGIRHLF